MPATPRFLGQSISQFMYVLGLSNLGCLDSSAIALLLVKDDLSESSAFAVKAVFLASILLALGGKLASILRLHNLVDTGAPNIT